MAGRGASAARFFRSSSNRAYKVHGRKPISPPSPPFSHAQVSPPAAASSCACLLSHNVASRINQGDSILAIDTSWGCHAPMVDATINFYSEGRRLADAIKAMICSLTVPFCWWYSLVYHHFLGNHVWLCLCFLCKTYLCPINSYRFLDYALSIMLHLTSVYHPANGRIEGP